MLNINDFGHYAAVSAIVALPALGVGIGQGLVNKTAVEMINEQPSAEGALRRLAIVSMTLSETAALLGLVMGILLLTNKSTADYRGYAYLGIIAALAIPGFVVGLVSALPGRAALRSTARQPLFANKILQLLLLTQTIIQTPIIFGFIICLVIQGQASSVNTLSDGIRLLASGLGFGLGSLGPLIGLGRFTEKACAIVGMNRDIYPKLRTFTFISQALIEAPVVFALLVSLVLISSSTTGNVLADSVAFLAAASVIALTTLGTGINSGRTARAATIQMGERPELYPILSKMSILSQTFVDTTVIYGLLMSLIILLTR